MSVTFKRSPGALIALSLALGTGCAAKNPEWLTAPAGAFCTSELSEKCLKGFAEHAYLDATAKAARAIESKPAERTDEQARPPEVAAIEPTEALAEGGDSSEAMCPVPAASSGDSEHPASDQEPADAVAERQSGVGESQAGEGGGSTPSMEAATEQGATGDDVPAPTAAASPPAFDDGSINVLGFGVSAIGATPSDAPGYQPSERVLQSRMAGALLNLGGGPVTSQQLEQAAEIADPALRAETLSGLLTLYSRSMTQDQIDGVLNILYDLDQKQYADALIIKLPGLLKVGDLERAKALRQILLGGLPRSSRSFSMLAYVASCYTMAGLREDAGAIVRESAAKGTDLSGDDRKLISMAINVANGGYPPMQDFYDYRSDEVRLHAYLTLAVIARQLDLPAIAHRAVADAVKFIQKSSVKIDRQKALGQILALAPGVI